MTHILVIDDDPAITSMLRRGLSYEGYIVTVAHDGMSGLTQSREVSPDVIILDLMMPGMDGLEVLHRIRKADARLPVILLTAKDTPDDQVQGILSGADDYLTKPFVFDVLLARVQLALRHRSGEPQSALQFADIRMNISSHTVERGDRPIQMTALEFRLLQEFLIHPNQVLSKDVLLIRVWGYDVGGSDNLVEVYIKQLRQKLESQKEPRVIHTIRNTGYVLRQEW
jgi:DNA-binding response OmpR family regulator